jgi:hypothetical protein
MIEQASLIIGDGNWAVKSDSLLGYALPQGKYTPREMSVVRATTGTRVNAAGLVELVPYNLLQYSEEFDNAAWNRIALGLVSNDATAPNGTLTADKITPDTTTAQHQIRQLSFSYNALTSYTYSVYFKPNGYNAIVMRMAGTTAFGTSFGIVVKFDASTMVTTIIDGAPTTTFTSVGNGWYRCSITATTVAAQSAQAIPIYPNNWDPYAGDGTSGIYIWGAQLVEGTEPLDYLPTTDRLDIARIDYSTGEAALLVEPQRTNLLTWSEQFDNASWIKTNATVMANATTTPSGTTTADTFIPNTGQAAANVNRTISVVVSPYTFSIYAKSFGQTKISLVSNLTGTFRAIVFNLLDGSVVTATGWTSAIESIGDGWYRCSATADAASASSYSFQITNNSTGWIGDGTSGVLIWGAQLEAGAYPTSYIPTTSASVTRNQDVISKTGISSLIGQTEGTLFIEFQYQKATSDANGRLLQLWATNDTQNSIVPLIGQTNQFQLSVFKNGASQIPIVAGPATVVPFGRTKIAIRYNVGTYSVYKNGVLFASGTGHYPTTLTSLNLGSTSFADRNLSNPIYSACLFPTALSNSELITLTTL